MTDEGIVMEARLVQPQKQDSPSEVRDGESVMEVKSAHSVKQPLPRIFTDEGSMTEVKPL